MIFPKISFGLTHKVIVCAALVSTALAVNAEPKLSLSSVASKVTESNDSTDFKKSLKDAQVHKGMFTTYLDKKGKLTFEIPDSAFNHTYLLVNRIKGLSRTDDYVAGQMCSSPSLIKFTKDGQNVYMHLVQTDNEVDPNDPISASFDRNFIDPVLKGFKIVGTDSVGSVFIDVTSFFAGNEKAISPIKESNPLTKLLGGKDGIKGTFYADGSVITNVKSFPQNLEVESQLAYTTQTATRPYTVLMSRSIVMLPDEPMPSRLQDNRVGYFSTDKYLYSSNLDRIKPYAVIHRHRLQPKAEDREAYFAGQLVEPEKKIVFYIDSAFPDKWRGAVKEGIEYWNTAFEAAGFKNAIEARDYPKDDPDFDPDDIRYSCIRYCVTPTANAMGPSYVDPRTGEILGADVIWYHNILSLLHNWRFTQTAAVDPRVRTSVFADSVMYESLTYVAAHEVGHCLGLMHNMGASHAFTLDNLRDPKFTQKYGTTPSIMDYARNNFVAQPGDMERGVRLTPPPVGVYDIYAINWGYRLIPEAKTMEEEKPVLDAWIREKDGDKMYEFGAQQFMGLVDPTDQTEDLGNDHIKAADMAISNLKIIMKNLDKWAAEPGSNYDSLDETYHAMVQQYLRHVGHVYPYIGGMVFKEIRQGHDDGDARTYIDKKQQKRAMEWLLDQARTCDWLAPADLMLKWEEPYQWQERMQRAVVGCLLSSAKLYRIKEGGKIDPSKNYKLEDYLDDAVKGIFATSYAGKNLSDTDRTMQAAAIAAMTKYSGLQSAESKSSSKALTAVDEFEELTLTADNPVIPCNHCMAADQEESTSFFRILIGLPTMPETELQPIMASRLEDILSLYESKSGSGDRATRDFYNYHIRSLKKLLDK